MKPWTCYARPAATGRTCFALNAAGIRSQAGVICCATCGATKAAGDDRKKRGQIDPVGKPPTELRNSLTSPLQAQTSARIV